MNGFLFRYGAAQQAVLVIVCLVALALLARLLVTLGGHDYAYFLPRLLDNHLYYQANGLGIKEYTASFCAGIFEFANPQSLALSLPQLLASLFGPVAGIQLTYIAASAAAGAGLYGCARGAGLTQMSALIAALLMTFNGFLLTRMMVGHLTFFNLGFGPVIAMFMLYGVQAYASSHRARSAVFGGAASLLATSIIYGGGGVMIPQIAAMVGLLLLVCGGFATRWHVWFRFFGFVSVATLLMSAPKLEAMLALTGNLRRDFYPLPGVGVTDLPLVVLQTVLWIPNADLLNNVLQNKQFFLSWHEWNYSVSPIWVLLVASGLVMGHRAGNQQMKDAVAWLSGSSLRTAALLIILTIPLALNIYTPSWNATLKSLPVIGESSSMMRWLLVYMPALCLLAGWVWRHVDKVRLVPLGALVIGLSIQQYQIHSKLLATELDAYDQTVITTPWHNGDAKRIAAVGAPFRTNKDGKRVPVMSSNFDHLFVAGSSNALCYEPMFGYRLELMDRRHLRVSNINVADRNGLLPMKNPACYVYPEENNCRPGAHFTSDQYGDVETLTAYGRISARASALRDRLNMVAGVAFLAVFGTILTGMWRTRRRRSEYTSDSHSS